MRTRGNAWLDGIDRSLEVCKNFEQLQNSIGEMIREWLEVTSNTRQSLAEGVGVSRAYISQLEHGKRTTPTVDVIRKILQYMDT